MSKPVLSPEKREAVMNDLLSWFQELHIEIPAPEPVIMRWVGGEYENIAQADYEEDEDLWIDPETPTLEDLAQGVISTVERHAETFPGKRNWRRWKFTGSLFSWLASAGIATGYVTSGGGMDPHRTPIHSGIGFRGKRGYVLFHSRAWWAWWACQRMQRFALRRHVYRSRYGDRDFCEICYPVTDSAVEA